MNRSTVLAVISAAVAVMMFVPAAYSATTFTSVESQDNVIGIIPVPVETVIDANGGSSVISGTGGDYHLVESEDGGVYVQKDENDPDHEVGSGNFDVTLKMPANSKFYIKVVYAPDYVGIFSNIYITVTADGIGYSGSISGSWSSKTSYFYLEALSSESTSLSETSSQDVAKNSVLSGNDVTIKLNGYDSALVSITAEIFLVD
ncbi:hypothetical protein [Methanomethylophilus alvi]|uniref:hypothetical protein n=1 Tax=Methanomethylophilus alvi TaxID=1291540 RepID=UPI0037DC51E8